MPTPLEPKPPHDDYADKFDLFPVCFSFILMSSIRKNIVPVSCCIFIFILSY